MKVQPFAIGGLEIIPENEWEEAYLFLTEFNLSSKLFRSSQKNSKLQSFILIDKDMGDSVL